MRAAVSLLMPGSDVSCDCVASLRLMGLLRRWAAQTVSYTLSHSLGIVLDLGGRIGGRLPHLFGVRWLGATRAAARQQQEKRHCDGRWKGQRDIHIPE